MQRPDIVIEIRKGKTLLQISRESGIPYTTLYYRYHVDKIRPGRRLSYARRKKGTGIGRRPWVVDLENYEPLTDDEFLEALC